MINAAEQAKLPNELGGVRLAGSRSFDCDSIANDAPNQWRWLSLPGSRLVLNPTASDDFAPMPTRADLPLHAAYFAGRRPHRLPDLLTIGVKNSAASTKSPRGEKDDQAGLADEHSYAWYPYKLAFKARYRRAEHEIAGLDFLADENTVLRIIDVAPGGDGGILQFHGVAHGQVRPDDRAVLVEQDDFFYAIIIGQAAGKDLTPARLDSRPEIRDRKWHLDIAFSAARQVPASPPGADSLHYFAAVGFATRAEGADTAVRRAHGVLSGPGLAQLLQAQKARWNDYLGRVPAPKQFGITAANPREVTPDLHRRFYYGAWAFVISNVLPAMSENDYPYPQTPCGKPSLWNFGASKAPASAAWESFFGQQMLAYVMPETAWAAFEGIMGQVDQTGWLDGECLPSRKAQTAWILYSLSGDTARLRGVYPAIRRYLLWREQNPRWIYLDHNNPDEKDASFVDQLLVDIDFAVRIARILGENADIEMWGRRREVILKNYREWFFFTDGRPPAEYYFTESKRHNPGNPNWVVTGLHISGLPADLAAQLKDLYRKRHHPDRDFCGMGWTKYGTESFTAYGLIEHGMFKEAREFINANLRDQIRAGEFSENYAGQRDGPPRPWGVKPSLFGAVQMIDFTCMNNGVRLDQGPPQEIRWPLDIASRPAQRKDE